MREHKNRGQGVHSGHVQFLYLQKVQPLFEGMLYENCSYFD